MPGGSDIGIVKPVRIEDEMKGAYLDYAMSVITARALPDVRDGLKPVQRRILYAMDELGLRPSSAYKKSARIVGEVMGKYHPHGDSPVYEAMVRMAQDFSMRYQLVDGQGNFGSVDGDPPAAMRYTEARLAAIAEELLADIDKNTVDFAANFDDTLKEPSVLPSKLPNLLVNGAAGIAVGMATNIPPHNLGEVADALAYIIGRFGEALDGGVPFALVWSRAFNTAIDPGLATRAFSSLKPELRDRVAAVAAKLAKRPDAEQRANALFQTVDDLVDVPPDKLMELIKGPDFPTAAVIFGGEGIKNAYATGHGRITIRARAHFEDMRGGRQQIVVTELPFQVNKATLLEKIAELVRDRRVDGISELRDESDREGMRVVIELRREAQSRNILNQLYKFTAMQTTFSVNMLALVDGQPRVLTLKMVLLHYLNHRREVITRRTEFDLQRAKHRAHILEGLKIALDHLDEVIATIRRSKDAETARLALIKNFKLTEIQAQAILDMQLRRLAALERQKIRDEYAQTLRLITSLEDLLAHPAKILYLIRDELVELKSKFGDARRTRIVAEEAADFSEEDLIPEQEVVISISVKGYVRRVAAETLRLRKGARIGARSSQRASTAGVAGVLSKEDDPPLVLALASTRDNLLLFSNKGRAYQVKVHELPDTVRQARGLPISNFLTIDDQERIVAAMPVGQLDAHSLIFSTAHGEVKRVPATEYASARTAGIIGLSLSEGDELIGAVLDSGRLDVLLVTAAGQAIRFAGPDLRPSGRTSGGVRGVKLADKDRVVAVDLARAGSDLVVVTRHCFAKRVPLTEFGAQGRGGGGIRAATVSVKNGELVGAGVGDDGAEIVLSTATGTILRAPLTSIATMSRGAQGEPLLSLARDDRVLAMAIIPGSKQPEEPKNMPSAPDQPKKDRGAEGVAARTRKVPSAPTRSNTPDEGGSMSSIGKASKGKAKSAPPPKVPAKAGKVAASPVLSKPKPAARGSFPAPDAVARQTSTAKAVASVLTPTTPAASPPKGMAKGIVSLPTMKQRAQAPVPAPPSSPASANSKQSSADKAVTPLMSKDESKSAVSSGPKRKGKETSSTLFGSIAASVLKTVQKGAAKQRQAKSTKDKSARPSHERPRAEKPGAEPKQPGLPL